MKYLIPGKGTSYSVAAVLPVLHTFDKRIIPAEFVDNLLIVESSKDVDNLLEKLTTTNSEYLVVSDAALWKKLVKKRKTQGWEGYVLPCALEDFSYFKVVYAPIPLLHDVSGFLRGVRTAFDHIAGLYAAPKSPVTVRKLTELSDIAKWLRGNVNTPLSVDIETFSLKHWDSGIGSIAFATSPTEATSFAVDLHPESAQIRHWLKQWFERRDAWTLYHNATFDAYILLYQLWMAGLRDLNGMREGIRHITRNIHCSKIISYLALNSAQEISLSLKDLAQEFMGAWAVDEIENIRAVPLDELLQYNGEDAAAAMWVHQKHLPTATEDGQLAVYNNIFKPAITDVIEMQIVGIPFSMKRVKRVYNYLNAFQRKAERTILGSNAAISTSNILAENWAIKKNATLKKKRVTASDWPESFNIGSDQQLSVMLFDVMGLPVLEVTKTGQPSTDGDTLTALAHHTDVTEYKEVLSALLDWRDSQKLLTAFFPSLLDTPQAEDGWHYLCGGYNIGGTLSGRLSCVAEWTRVQTQRGLVPIRDLMPGDLAWTHERRWRPITNLIKKPVDEMVDVCFSNGYVLTCTTAHKLKLPTGRWVTVQEIIDDCIQIVDGEPNQYQSDSGSCKKQPDIDVGCFGRTVGNEGIECESGTADSHAGCRVHSTESTTVFHLQGRREEPYAGEIWRTAPTLGRGSLGQQGIHDTASQWRAPIYASCGDGQRIRASETPRGVGCPSHRLQSLEQCAGQSCLGYKSRTQDNPFPAADQRYGEITAINPRGPLQVWDITVEEDHSYWAEGCFSHNSSGPNMQQLPSTGARFARWFKYMFVAPPGWLFCGADFNALESRIDALKTKDPNKLVVYTQGYDSHSWNAYGYWGDQMPDVVLAEPGEECYKANVGDTYVYFTESEEITYAGRKFTGREFRDFCASQGV